MSNIITRNHAETIVKVLGVLQGLDGEGVLCPEDRAYGLGRVPLCYEGVVIGVFHPDDEVWIYEDEAP